jgi:hypothetical protein
LQYFKLIFSFKKLSFTLRKFIVVENSRRERFRVIVSYEKSFIQQKMKVDYARYYYYRFDCATIHVLLDSRTFREKPFGHFLNRNPQPKKPNDNHLMKRTIKPLVLFHSGCKEMVHLQYLEAKQE